MDTAYTVVTLLAVVANGSSGIVSLCRFEALIPAMRQAGIPVSWARFPIGTLKTAGAAGLLLGVLGVPLVGEAAAIGLVLFFVCAVYTHVLAYDYQQQFFLGIGFLLLNVATLVAHLTV